MLKSKLKILIFSLLFSKYNICFLDHKNENISQYLNEISAEQEEKTQILEHILKKESGCYLDLGTGGDSLSYLLKRIPSKFPVTLIGADLDESILNSIPRRHPELAQFLSETDINKDNFLQCKLIKMDASNMEQIEKNSIDGISASALTHEIFSYVSNKTNLDQFFIELIRVLKQEGIFVYRDPKWDENPEQDCLLILTDNFSKFFSTLFMPRFLDRKLTKRRDYRNVCTKPNLYKDSHIRINYFSKDSNLTKKAKIDEFINIPSSDIDFTKNISIEAPRGLISEIQRHYILFLKNVFITELIDKNFLDRDFINIENLPQDEKIILTNFLKNNKIQSSLVSTSVEPFKDIRLEKQNLYNFIENGTWFEIIDNLGASKFCSDLYNNGISKNIIYIDGKKLWVDPKLTSIIFQDFYSGLFSFVKFPEFAMPKLSLEWLKREGEEYYFYKTTDELITYIGQITKYYLKETDKDGFILCPISPDYIKTVSRRLYKEIVNKHMTVMDIDGNKADIIFDKNIIHFKLMKFDEALKIYNEIIKQNKGSFPKLTEWVHNDVR